MDPIHEVEGPCADCGTTVPPFAHLCPDCETKRDALREEERQARLAGPAPFVEPDPDVTPDEGPESHGQDPNPEYTEARKYAGAYTGSFDFMLCMKERVTGPKGVRGPLSRAMVAAILKCKEADERRATERAEREAERKRNQTGRDLNVLPYGRTCAAVENESGALTFLLFDRPGERDRFGQPSKWHGWVFVKQQQGPDEVRLGSQRPGETYAGQWPSLVDKVLADPMAAVARYGLELGVCGVCGKALTNEESREAGIGPVCLRKLGGEEALL
jgi:hypothetical protein